MIPICSICLECFTPNCIVKHTMCGHMFHRACVLPWLRSNPTCPECRQYGPVLNRLYLHFQESTIENNVETVKATKYLEELEEQLSEEKSKNEALQKRIQELESKLSSEQPLSTTTQQIPQATEPASLSMNQMPIATESELITTGPVPLAADQMPIASGSMSMSTLRTPITTEATLATEPAAPDAGSTSQGPNRVRNATRFRFLHRERVMVWTSIQPRMLRRHY